MGTLNRPVAGTSGRRVEFTAGRPACPIACSYCSVTELAPRRDTWNANPVAGINKACTYLNVTPWINDDPEEQAQFRSFPFDLLHGDVVGFTAVTDPLWPRLRPWLDLFLEQVVPQAKLVTLVSKWPARKQQLEPLAGVPSLRLVVTITGAETLERTTWRNGLATLEAAKDLGIAALPIVHPYISGVSDLSFLPHVAELGYQEIGVKGFRYHDATMRDHLPDATRMLYLGRDGEYLPEDGWRDRVADTGLSLLSPAQWYQQHIRACQPQLDLDYATELVDRVLAIANVTSSDPAGVRGAAIARRL